MAFEVGVVAPPAGVRLPMNELPTLRLATAGADGTVRVWNVRRVPAPPPGKPETPDSLLVLRGSLGAIRSVDFRPDGKPLVAGAADGGVTLWNLEPFKPEAQAKDFGPPTSLALQASMPRVAVASLDGKPLASTATINERPAILVRDLEQGKVRQTLLGHDSPVVSLAFSNDGTKLVSGSTDKTARVWDLADAKFPEIARFAGHTSAVTAVVFNTDGQQVLSGSADNSAKLWAVADAKELMSFAGHTGPIVAVAMPNNQPLIAGRRGRSGDHCLQGWDQAVEPRRRQSAPLIHLRAAHRSGVRIRGRKARQRSTRRRECRPTCG